MPSGLRIKRGLVKHYMNFLSCISKFNQLFFYNQTNDFTFSFTIFITQEGRLFYCFFNCTYRALIKYITGHLCRRSCLLTLFFHFSLKTTFINSQTALFQDRLRHLEWKTKGIIQLKSILA